MKTVLLIDDDRAFRGLVAEYLAANGWRVVEAEDGERGLAMALEQKPDAVVCDLLMPRGNGFQVCRGLRGQIDLVPQPGIVVTTGSAYAADRFSALEAGANEYLVKPINPSDLSRILQQLVGGRT